MLVDTHAHLYDESFINDIDTVMARCIENGIEKIYLPNCNSETIQPLLQLTQKFPLYCKPMMGLHPCYVKQDVEKELEIMKAELNEKKFSAVGEIGLDYYWDKTFIPQQKNALHQQIEMALHYQLPIVLHSRDSIRDTIDIVKKYVPQGIKGVFHCFTGSFENAREIIDMNFFIGIGGVITYKNAGIQEVIKKIGLQNIVLETDAPYLTPVPHRGKRNESSYLKIIAEKIAELKNISFEKVAECTTQNAAILFKEL